jgi:coenzyme F420-dependent glucose-6-phosphate dehydrogenase
VWTLGDPERVPKILDAYRASAGAAGREPGEVILQAGFSWAADDDAALEGARVWKATQPDEFYTEDWHDPAAMQRHAAATISDEEFMASMPIGSSADVHVETIEKFTELGATIVSLQNMSGADPHGAIDFYGREVLPRVRG